MADEQDETQQVEDEVLELTEEVQTPEESEETEAEAQSEDDEEVIVSFGDEAPPASGEQENSTIRQMRVALREKEARIKELEQDHQPAAEPAGKEPDLWEDCEGDENRWKQDWKAWDQRRQTEEAAKSEAQKAQEEHRERYEAKVAVFGEQKTALAARDFDEAEAVVRSVLTDAQQAILIEGAEDKAKLVYALGKHPEKLKQLAASKNLIEFAFAAARLEGQTKMERRKPATSPESRISGSGQISQEGKLSDKLSPDEWRRRRNEQVRKR